jgi:hypothetical protein
MNEQTKPYISLTEKAEAAFQQVARKVVERAKQTGTPIVVWKDGRVTELSPEQFADFEDRDR